MEEKKENFVITYREGAAIVERNFDIEKLGTLSYKITVPKEQVAADSTLIGLHQASADAVIRQLLQFLPEGYDKDNPYRPGQKK